MEAKRFFDGAGNIMNDANQRYKKKEEPKSQKYDLGTIFFEPNDIDRRIFC